MRIRILKMTIAIFAFGIIGVNTYLLYFDKTHHYMSNQSANELKNEILKELTYNKKHVLSTNLSGRFTTEDEFILYPKFSLIVIKNSFGDSRVVTLKGKIKPISLQMSDVTFISEANSVFYILPIIISLMMFLSLFRKTDLEVQDKQTKANENNTLIGAFIMLVFVFGVCFLLSYYTENSLKTTFISVFKLQMR